MKQPVDPITIDPNFLSGTSKWVTPGWCEREGSLWSCKKSWHDWGAVVPSARCAAICSIFFCCETFVMYCVLGLHYVTITKKELKHVYHKHFKWYVYNCRYVYSVTWSCPPPKVPPRENVKTVWGACTKHDKIQMSRHLCWMDAKGKPFPKHPCRCQDNGGKWKKLKQIHEIPPPQGCTLPYQNPFAVPRNLECSYRLDR